MSETPNDNENEPDAEFPATDDAAPRIEVETAKPARPWRRTAIKWLLILAVIVALAGAGYWQFLEWQQANEQDATDTASAEIESLRAELRRNREAITALEADSGSLEIPDYSGDIDAVRSEVEEQLDLLRSLPARMTRLENSVASLAGISEGARETFLLAEAEYYMQIANAQLQLANNPELATLALRMADERVTQLADPGLTTVRQSLSDELTALEVMEKPDIEGASITLASLSRVVESLPLAGIDAGDAAQSNGAEDAPNAADRAWSSVKDAMSGLVKVTPPEQAKLAVISPDAEYFLRSNVALQLQAARLALLRGEHTIFTQSLDDATALLTAYFDAQSEQVKSALASIDDVRQGIFVSAPPDIAGSLRLLRQYRTLSENRE